MKTPRSFTNGHGRNGFPARLNGHHPSGIELDSQINTERLLSPPRSLLKETQSPRQKLKIVILGSTLTGPDHCGQEANYPGLMRELSVRGHDVLFLERGSGERTALRDWPGTPGGSVDFHSGLQDLKDRFAAVVRDADFVMVDSHVCEGAAIGEWITRTAQGATAFYDFDLPVTMANLNRGMVDCISETLVRRYDLYLSSTGGVLLDYFGKQYGSRMARPLYFSVDAMHYFPERHVIKWDVGYDGDYDANHQPVLERLLIEPARRWDEGRFLVAGSRYPRSIHWPKNVSRTAHFSAARRRTFYSSQRFTLNLASPGTIAAGFSPSARLFEAAACCTPVITEFWPGLDTFFKPDEEILISHSPDETLIYLEEISELDRRRMGYRARERVLSRHTVRHRAAELEGYALEVLKLTRTTA